MIHSIKDHAEGRIHDSDLLRDVTLTGGAGRYAKKMVVLDAARCVPGGRDVANALQFHGSIFVCFAGQEKSRTTEDSETARVVTSSGCLTKCDGQGCSAESQQVDGWLFVGPAGQQRHYCRACLVSYLEGIRHQSAPEQRAATHGTRTASPGAAPAPPTGGMITRSAAR